MGAQSRCHCHGTGEPMTSTSNKPIVRSMLRWLLAGTFLYAGGSKLAELDVFAVAVDSYQLVPYGLIGAVAFGLPVYELVCGFLALLSGRWRRIGLAGLILMTLVFAVALVSALVRGLGIDCGCFGGGPVSSGGLWLALFRDLLLWVVAVYLYIQELSVISRD